MPRCRVEAADFQLKLKLGFVKGSYTGSKKGHYKGLGSRKVTMIKKP